MKIICSKKFANGAVYLLKTSGGNLVEATDTFLPYETIKAVKRKTNILPSHNLGSRKDRWMIGISTMSGCSVKCKFCAVAKIPHIKTLSADEMVEQVDFILSKNKKCDPFKAKEFRVLFTRMGEPALNTKETLRAISKLNKKFPHVTIAISTIGVNNEFAEELLKLRNKSGKDYIQMQFSIHSTSEKDRDYLQPYKDKMDFAEINDYAKKWVKKGYRKVTLNFTITRKEDRKFEFDIKNLKKHFDPKYFFIKISPLNENVHSKEEQLKGLVKEKNIA